MFFYKINDRNKILLVKIVNYKKKPIKIFNV